MDILDVVLMGYEFAHSLPSFFLPSLKEQGWHLDAGGKAEPGLAGGRMPTFLCLLLSGERCQVICGSLHQRKGLLIIPCPSSQGAFPPPDLKLLGRDVRTTDTRALGRISFY